MKKTKRVGKRFWTVFGVFNFVAVLYLFANSVEPETDSARLLAAAALVGALLALFVVDVIAVSVAHSNAATR